MANLLPRDRDPDLFPALDDGQRARIRERLAPLARLDRTALVGPGAEPFVALGHELTGELEELDEAPTLAAAQAILARVDRARATAAEGARASVAPDAAGLWLCYRPGRSLDSGEAEVASRGFFDVRDRPPLGLWVDAIARPWPGRPGSFEVAVLCWIPPIDAARARAGRAHCPTGALALFEELVAGRPPVDPVVR